MDAANLTYDQKPPTPEVCASAELARREGWRTLRSALLACLSFN